jgi:hypothetical protein
VNRTVRTWNTDTEPKGRLARWMLGVLRRMLCAISHQAEDDTDRGHFCGVYPKRCRRCGEQLTGWALDDIKGPRPTWPGKPEVFRLRKPGEEPLNIGPHPQPQLVVPVRLEDLIDPTLILVDQGLAHRSPLELELAAILAERTARLKH